MDVGFERTHAAGLIFPNHKFEMVTAGGEQEASVVLDILAADLARAFDGEFHGVAQAADGKFPAFEGLTDDVEDEAGDEILVLAAGAAGLVQGHADHFVASANGTVPGTVFGGENIAAIFRGKLSAFIEGQLERSVVGLEENVGDDCLVFQFRMLAVVPRILMAADVPPGPAIEASFLDMSNVIGDEIVAQAVASPVVIPRKISILPLLLSAKKNRRRVRCGSGAGCRVLLHRAGR